MLNKKSNHGFDYLRDLVDSQDTVLCETDVAHVIKLTDARNFSVRNLAAQVAGLYYAPCFERALIKLLRDRRMIVRVYACDSLSNSDNANISKHLLPMMRRVHPSERGYAILSYSDREN